MLRAASVSVLLKSAGARLTFDEFVGMVVRDVADGAREHHGAHHLAQDPEPLSRA
jgi:hypothetical protein